MHDCGPLDRCPGTGLAAAAEVTGSFPSVADLRKYNNPNGSPSSDRSAGGARPILSMRPFPYLDPIEVADLPPMSSPPPSPSSAAALRIPTPCPHLAAYRSSEGSRPLRSLHPCLLVRPLGRAEVRLDPGEVPRCATCHAAGVPRLYACLSCAAVHCPVHGPAHAAAAAGHEIAVDVDRAELFCCACGDQVYDRDFDSAVVLAQAAAAPISADLELDGDEEEGVRKRRRVEYRPWNPNPKERAVIWRGSSPLYHQEENITSSGGSRFPWGLRGLNNLGNTCFVNSVLQALLHTPLLRNYFLSDRHNRFICQQRSRRKKCGSAGEQKAAALCLSCDLDAMYSAVFSGDRRPYSPAKFLYSWWQHASHLASYEQQDAHDFFITMLDGIHEKEREQNKPHEGSGDCCIVHKVFSGTLRSDVTCTICGYTSTTYDPCMDISLDLDYGKDSMKSSTSSFHACNGKTDSVRTQNCGLSTLLGCLERFTRSERLGSDQKLFCQHCQVKQESLKQMSIRKLPLVISFHIKRFEHSQHRNMSKKIDRYVQFPFYLDMAPYLSSSILRNRFGNRIFSFDDGDTDVDMQLASEFELFAVITHSGKLESGHYTTYLRQNNQWYKCDDAWITHVSENTVRASQAYMLFYVQKILHYKANENVVAS